mmetsp:Transcript_27687/g.45340  ORF Transcript_27687/g.45340 Transcript_27687/m.45340 type:complete len:341 (+) Transcript_27687:125-1147(+)
MYGSSEAGVLPLQQGSTPLGGWMGKIGLPAMQMVKREPYPKLGPEMLKISSLPFQNDRRRINAVPIILSLLIPWFIFVIVCGSVSFYWRYSSPGICCFLVSFIACIVIFFGATTYHQYRKRAVFNEPAREPTWFGPLFVMSLLCWIFGLVIGNSNFSANMAPYYNFKSFQAYPDVHPGITSGKAVLDGGIFIFTPTTSPDVSKAVSFKTVDTYCVAPVVSDSKPLIAYDFWAVGKNCCSGDMADFSCGEFNNPAARGGLRLLADNERSFYRLAVQQAEAMYHLKAVHPLFFYWAQDPVAEMTSWKQEGYKFYFIGIFVHFLWQLLSVGLATMGFSKMGHY